MRLTGIGLCLAMFAMGGQADAQLRIVSYNTTPRIDSQLIDVLVGIETQDVNGIHRPIDILALQEQSRLHVETERVLTMLNAKYGDGTYARSRQAGQGSLTQAVIYNTRSVELLAEDAIGVVSGQGNARQTLRYQFRPQGYGEEADLFIYNSHFKANNNEQDAARRAVEATANRADAATLGNDASIIYLGDFNLYRNTEPAFEALVGETLGGDETGRAFDPIDQMGIWSRNGRYRRWHTQSTTVGGGDNRAGGGVNDRFDFQLVSAPLMDGDGLSYLGASVIDRALPEGVASSPVEQESYRVFGNNGSHFTSRNISTGTGAEPEMLTLLERVSDHLPVVADYQLPAQMELDIANVPARVLQHTSLSVAFDVRNAAPVSQYWAADELDYVLDVETQTPAEGQAFASLPARSHVIALPTGAVGAQDVAWQLTASSANLADPDRRGSVSYDVLARGEASFTADSRQLTREVDFGIWVRGEPDPTLIVDLFNRSQANVETASVQVGATDEVGPFSISLGDTEIAANESTQLTITLQQQTEVGRKTQRWSLPTFDEALLGAAEGVPLELTANVLVLDPSAGDFDDNGILDIADLVALREALQATVPVEMFDVNRDGRISPDDVELWVLRLKDSAWGDANLDGTFNSTDLVSVFVAGEYEDLAPLNSTWQTGDWNGDDEFDSSDIVLAFEGGGYRQSASRHAALVPEPCTWLLGSVSLIALVVVAVEGSRRRDSFRLDG